jgi:hypothetical protein
VVAAVVVVIKVVAVEQVVIWPGQDMLLLLKPTQLLLVLVAMVSKIPPTLRLSTVAIPYSILKRQLVVVGAGQNSLMLRQILAGRVVVDRGTERHRTPERLVRLAHRYRAMLAAMGMQFRRMATVISLVAAVVGPLA